jgi:hypothetical protein
VICVEKGRAAHRSASILVGGPHLFNVKGTEGGAISRCPYCLASLHPWPPIGTTIIFLNGSVVGQSGMVVADQWGTCPRDRFLVKMSYDETGKLRMVMPSHELFLDAEMLAVPVWMPPVSIEDNAFLHNSLPDSLDKLTTECDRGSLGESLHSIIATCWRRRLPLGGADIWPFLNAHGVAPRLKAVVIDYFDFGTRLLTKTQGRSAVRRRRMPAMSKGRYLTKAQRDLRLKILGHD